MSTEENNNKPIERVNPSKPSHQQGVDRPNTGSQYETLNNPGGKKTNSKKNK